MAGFIQNLLTDTTKGFFGNDYMRDYTHASKTFRSDSYAYSPKFKFLFHVYFNLNKDLVPVLQSFPESYNFGLAVKNIQLPRFSFDLHDMNQYNRRRIVQTKIKYDPINITFHDDNGNLVRKLWYTYYTYYFKDATQTDSTVTTPKLKRDQPPFNVTGDVAKNDINRRNIYDSSDIVANSNDWGYVGETSATSATALATSIGQTKAPFFRSIDIYGFNQHNFTLYRLLNPIIESFGHDTYDYSQANGTMQNQMQLRYETVKYFEGALDGKRPNDIIFGFGEDSHYDKTVSPIARPGSNATILGQGGLLSAAGGFMDDLESGNYLGAIQKAGTAYNTFKNPGTIMKAVKGDLMNEVQGAVGNQPNRNSIFNFPAFNSTPLKNLATITPQSVGGAINTSIGSVLNSPPIIK